MPELDPEAWTETTSARERVRMVVETLADPATVTEVAEAAHVAWATADSELDRMVAENRAREVDADGATKYAPNAVQGFLDQIVALIEDNDREELEAQLVEYRSRIESLRDDHGAETAAELRERLTEDGRSAEELREIRAVAETWQALETELGLRKHALHLHEDVTQFSDPESRVTPP